MSWPRTRLGAVVLSVVAGAGLLAAGFEAGYHYLLPRVNQALEQATQATARANRLAADNASLERRVRRLEARLAECWALRRSSALTIRVGQMAGFIHGRLAVGVERTWPEAGKALVWMRSASGAGGRKLMAQGQGVRVKVGGRLWRVVLVRVERDRARISVVPAGP